eukprot:gene13450-9261_t
MATSYFILSCLKGKNNNNNNRKNNNILLISELSISACAWTKLELKESEPKQQPPKQATVTPSKRHDYFDAGTLWTSKPDTTIHQYQLLTHSLFFFFFFFVSLGMLSTTYGALSLAAEFKKKKEKKRDGQKKQKAARDPSKSNIIVPHLLIIFLSCFLLREIGVSVAADLFFFVHVLFLYRLGT